MQVVVPREDDRPIAAPGAATEGAGYVADRPCWTAPGVDPLERAFGGEAHVAAVGRPERMSCLLRAQEGLRGSCVETTQPKPPDLVLASSDEDDQRAIGRYREALARQKLGSPGHDDCGADQARWLVSGLPQQRSEGGCRDYCNGRDRPRNALTALAPGSHRRGEPRPGTALLDPAELELQIVRRLPALFGVLVEAGSQDALERGWRERLKRRDGRRLVLEHCGDQAHAALAREGRAAREHLEEQRSEREDVGARPPRRPRAAREPCTGRCPESFRPR